MDALLKFLNKFPSEPGRQKPIERMLADGRITQAVADRLMQLDREITRLVGKLGDKRQEREALVRGADAEQPEPFDEAFYGPYGTEQQSS